MADSEIKRYIEEKYKEEEILEMKKKSLRKILQNKKRKNAGITLLALVLTIVVLIILATVSINMLFGENGLVTSANFEIIKGELYVNTADDLEIRVAQALGLNVNPYLIIDGVLMSANQNLGLQTGSNTLTIPGSVTAIGAGAFSGVKGLKEVIIPGTVKEIRNDAFSYNTEIEKITIQKGVESIGTNAFYGSSSLQEIIIPDSVTN